MTGSALKELLENSGVTVWASVDGLRWQAPKGAFTRELKQLIQSHRTALLDHLRSTGCTLPPVSRERLILAEPPAINTPPSQAEIRLWRDWWLEQLIAWHSSKTRSFISQGHSRVTADALANEAVRKSEDYLIWHTFDCFMKFD